MATIRKMNGKNKLSYQIIVHCGYDYHYRKVRKYKTWSPPQGWTEKRAEKEVQRIAYEFEQKIRQGYQTDSKQTFSEYARYVIGVKERSGVKHNTLNLYDYLMQRIEPQLGYLKLTEIRPQHINDFYTYLSQDTIVSHTKKVYATANIAKLLTDMGWTKTKLAEQAGISHTTVTTACRKQRIMREKAQQIADALQRPLEEVFAEEKAKSTLSTKTIREYHRFIRMVLGQAEKELIVPYNAAAKATPPKSKPPQANYFQPEQVRAILNALEEEPLQWRTITHLMIVTGCRRGEVMGLTWGKVNLDDRKIKIDTNLLYSKTRGIYTGSTKTENVRYIIVPDETVALLREHRAAQNALRKINGDRWQDTDFIFTQDNGLPMHPSSITAWLAEFSKRHGLPHINPHAFRHTVASILIANNMDIVTVSKQLGHSKVSTTDDFYAHIIEEERAKTATCMSEVLLKGRSPK